MQSCDSTCYWCSRWFFQWLRDRMFAIQRETGGRSGDGSFARAAATSIKPSRDEVVEELGIEPDRSRGTSV